MTEERNKAAPPDKQQPVDKRMQRRERQAQALRRNLVRRKAQMRGRAKGDGPQSAATEAPGEPSPD